ncbi:Holliday junction resolvase RuvX [Viscerimonas tarda]
MARLLAIDYGTKRTGIAVSDTLKIIATGLTTLPSNELLAFLKQYLNKEQVELIIVGAPKQMNNEPSDNMKHVEAFVRKLKKEIPSVPVAYYDERFTSVMAHRVMLEGGLKKTDRQNKALVDEISAVIILQGYMESSLYMNSSNSKL